VAQVLKALDVVVLQMEVSHSSGDALNFSDAIVVQVQRTQCMTLQQVRLRDHNMPRQVAQATHHGLPTVQACACQRTIVVIFLPMRFKCVIRWMNLARLSPRRMSVGVFLMISWSVMPPLGCGFAPLRMRRAAAHPLGISVHRTSEIRPPV